MMGVFRIIGVALILYAIVVCVVEATLWLIRPDMSATMNDQCIACKHYGKCPSKYCHKKYCRWYRKEK